MPAPATGGAKTPADVRARRDRAIEQVYLRVQSVLETARIAKAQFGVSLTTTKRSLDRIRERWRVEASRVDPLERREQARRALLNDLEAARQERRWSTVCAMHRLLCELDGLLVEQVEVQHSRSPLDGLSVAELRFVRDHGRLPRPGEAVVVDAEVVALPARAG